MSTRVETGTHTTYDPSLTIFSSPQSLSLGKLQGQSDVHRCSLGVDPACGTSIKVGAQAGVRTPTLQSLLTVSRGGGAH